mmetsp:Transcript_793/g.1264  ORF Transcript_793/g.1264 Transcript_793/m.1264 type:complete len:548 (-) Transcript_793:614-2257(-)
MTTKGKASQRLSMKGQIHKAYKVLLKLINPKYMKKDKQIPLNVIKNAKGIAFVTTIKAGFVFTGTLGCGIVMARMENGEWSGPSSIGVGGMGWGLQIGANSTDSVIILNTKSAVKAFSGKGQIKFGGNLSVAAGPVGRDADAAVNAGDGGVAACYSYSHSRGIFAGLSLQGAVLVARESDNSKFYQTNASPVAVLNGIVTPPTDCEDLNLLFKTLRIITHSETEDYEYRDSVTGSMRFEDSIMQTNSSSSYPGDPYDGNYDSTEAFKDTYESSLGPAIAVPPAVPTPPPVPPASTLPPGWKELKTADGKAYYWNEQKNVTQWDKPVATATAPTVAPVAVRSLPTQGNNTYVPASTAAYSTSANTNATSGWGGGNNVPVASTVSTPSSLDWGGTPGATTTTPAPSAVPPVVPAKTVDSHQAELQRALSARPTSQAPRSVPPARPTPPRTTASTRPAYTQPAPTVNPAYTPAPVTSTPTPVDKPATPAPQPNYTYDQVCARSIPNMDMTKLDYYLTPQEFSRVFKMDRASFDALPKWKRDQMKKDKKLF